MIVISSLFQTEYSCHQTPFFNSLGGQSSSGSRYDNESRIYEEVFLTSNQEGRTKHTFYGKLHLIHESQNVILDTLQNVLELGTFSARFISFDVREHYEICLLPWRPISVNDKLSLISTCIEIKIDKLDVSRWRRRSKSRKRSIKDFHCFAICRRKKLSYIRT